MDKFVADKFSRIYGNYAVKPRHYVVFLIGNRKRAFQVSEFSCKSYKLDQQGTLKYKGTRLIAFR